MLMYKKYTKKDKDALIDLCESAWDYKDYTLNEVTRRDLIKLDAYASLIGSNYAEIVYDDTQIAGILIGASKGLFSSFRKVSYLFKTYGLIIRLSLFRKDAKRALKNFRNIDNLYKKLYKHTNKNFDAEVILFAVHPSMRGKHIGKTLINNYMNVLKDKGFKYIYLFTDTSCTYEFYNHMQFTKEQEASTFLDLINGKETLTAFLYSKSIT